MIRVLDFPTTTRDDIRVTRESTRVPPERWTTEDRADVAKIDEYLAEGFSVVVLNVDQHLPALGAVCDEIRSRMGQQSYAGLVATQGIANGAFRLHFDIEDLVILQIEGTKRWQIFRPAVRNPVEGMPKQPLPDAEPIFDEILQPGDMLLMRAGTWHHCECGPSVSVHLNVAFLPPNRLACNQ